MAVDIEKGVIPNQWRLGDLWLDKASPVTWALGGAEVDHVEVDNTSSQTLSPILGKNSQIEIHRAIPYTPTLVEG